MIWKADLSLQVAFGLRFVHLCPGRLRGLFQSLRCRTVRINCEGSVGSFPSGSCVCVCVCVCVCRFAHFSPLGDIRFGRNMHMRGSRKWIINCWMIYTDLPVCCFSRVPFNAARKLGFSWGWAGCMYLCLSLRQAVLVYCLLLFFFCETKYRTHFGTVRLCKKGLYILFTGENSSPVFLRNCMRN